MEIHSIELIGGGSRIPIFNALVKTVFGKEPFRSLDASSCIARGCAMMSAMISPLFKVASYGLEEINLYPIRATWNFQAAPGMEI
jgi:heat shock protein 4